jgi:lipocalin-like protein
MVQASVVGTWRLVSCEGRRATGEVSRPYGDAPFGLLMYGADGYMAGFVMRPGRPPFASGDRFRGSAEEMRAAHEGFQAYCGTYEVDRDRARIVHHVAADFFPNYVGTDLERHFALENGILVLETPPVVRGGQTWTLCLVWTRAVPAVTLATAHCRETGNTR